MHIDISPITQAAVGLAAAVLTILGGWALTKVTGLLKIQTTAAQTAAFDDALNKAIAYGVTASDAKITQLGWDHPTVKNAVAAAALDYVVARFPAALAGVGLTGDLTSPANIAVIQGAIQRALPGVALAASASPVTPPVTSPAAAAPALTAVKA